MKPRKLKRPQTRVDILNPGFGIPPLKRNEVQEMIRESAFPREKMMVDRIKKIESKLGMAGTEPECTCEPGWDEKCTCRGDTQAPPEPDLPLKARVAKALGKECSYITYQTKLGWYYAVPYAEGSRDWFRPILDYDKHVDLAMGALEEYCNTYNIDVEIKGRRYVPSGENPYLLYRIELGGMCVGEWRLPQAICEAIVAHAEQTK